MSHIHRFIIGLWAAAALAVGSLICPTDASAETTLEKVKRTKVMTAGNSGSYPPFEMMEGGKLVGFDVDMADELGKRMGGIQVKFEIIDFKGIVAALTSKRVDTLITALTWTPERANAIAFSIPYYDAGIGALTKPDSGIKAPEDLAGKIVGVQLGSSGDAFVRQKFGSQVKEIKTYDTILLAVKDLENGRVAAVVNPIPVLRHNSKGTRGLITTSVWDRRVVGINTRKEDADLMAEINKHLEAMQKDGTMERLDKKWFGG
jgi:polar amino acid transport system substrate-binding protein